MKLGIRCDGSPAVGAGHLVRCLEIATELAKAGVDLHFYGEVTIPWARKLLSDAGFPLSSLKNPARPAAELSELGVSAVLIDSYQYDEFELEAISAMVQVFQVCDTAPKDHAPWHTIFPYKETGSYSPLRLSGTKYLAIRGSFVGVNTAQQHNDFAEIKKLLILVGATDNYNEKVAMIELVTAVAPDLEIHVNVQDEDLNLIDYLCRSETNVIPGNHAGDLRPILTQVDGVFTLAGTTAWELFVAKIPTIVYAAFDNQRIVAETCAALGIDAITKDSEGRNSHSPSNRALMSRFIRDRSFRERQIDLAASQLDLKGSQRVANWIVEQMGRTGC